MKVFIVEDEMHAETCGEFSTYEEAFSELERRADIGWSKHPNICPCKNSTNCSRNYKIIKYENTTTPWKEISRKEVLSLSKKGALWL